MVAPSPFQLRQPAYLTSNPHLFTALACLSLFSFAMTSDSGSRWLLNGVKLLGAGAAIDAAMNVSDDADDAEVAAVDESNPVVAQLESLYNLPAINAANLSLNAPDFDALSPEAVEFLAYLEGKEWLDVFQGVRHYRRY